MDIRTVELATLLGGSGGDDGLPHTFSDDGRLAFVAFFTDGTRGMFVSDVATIPENSFNVACRYQNCRSVSLVLDWDALAPVSWDEW
jgi:hypothetical protein